MVRFRPEANANIDFHQPSQWKRVYRQRTIIWRILGPEGIMNGKSIRIIHGRSEKDY